MWTLILLAFSPEIPGLLPSAGKTFALDPARFHISPDTCRFQLNLILPGTPDSYRFEVRMPRMSEPLTWTRVLKTQHEFFIEPVQMTLPAGHHTLLLRVTTSRDTDSLAFNARCPRLQGFATSSLILLQPDGKPNPLRRAFWQHDTLHFYLEVYTHQPDTALLFAFVLDSTGDLRGEMKPLRVPLSRWRTPLTGRVPLGGLETSGHHVLQVILQTPKGRKQLRTFFRYEAPPFSDTLMEALAYFLPDRLRQTFRTLNRTQKVYFLRRHLSFLSPAVFATFRERLQYVNEHFREPGKAPYLTDRGRIYLVFGPPDRRLFYSELRNIPPQEHWIYYRPSMAFVFVDVDRSGTYRLAYSTEAEIPVTPGLEQFVYDEEGLLPKRTP